MHLCEIYERTKEIIYQYENKNDRIKKWSELWEKKNDRNDMKKKNDQIFFQKNEIFRSEKKNQDFFFFSFFLFHWNISILS